VITDIIRKLPPKIGIHAALTTPLAAKNALKAPALKTHALEANTSEEIPATIARPRFIKLAPIRHTVVLKLGMKPKSRPKSKPKSKEVKGVPRCDRFFALVLPFSLICAASGSPATAAGCSFEVQGEGRVAAVVDARSFRLEDGREIRLAGIEPVLSEKVAAEQPGRPSALSAMVAGHNVILRAEDDTPDRYGREPAFVFVEGSDISVQAQLVAAGEALVAGTVSDKDCALSLNTAESAARSAKKGTWADPAAIKNAESPGDILAGIGRFTVVEGKVLSVRQAGATTYLNFGRNWTQGFAVTISRRMIPVFEAAGIGLKSLENRKIRVRGWVEARGGPRIEMLRVGQLELLGGN
jgi:endonuclease YncB( thermonuclease family)